MKLSIPFAQAVSIAHQKAKTELQLMYESNDTIKVGYELSLKMPLIGVQKKWVYVSLKEDGIKDNVLYLTYHIDMLGGSLIAKVLDKIVARYTSIVEVQPGNKIVVYPDRIEQMGKALEQINVNSIAFEPEGILVDFDLK